MNSLSLFTSFLCRFAPYQEFVNNFYSRCLEIQTFPVVDGKMGNVYAEMLVKQIGKDEEGRPITIDYEMFEYLYLNINITDLEQVVGTDHDEGRSINRKRYKVLTYTL